MKHLFVFSFIFIFLIQEATASSPNIGITFSFPWVNTYRYVNYEHKTTNTRSGFFGLGFGAYYKKGDNKLSLYYGFTEDLDSPIGVINYSRQGTRTNIGSEFGELMYHCPVYKNLNGIIGFNYSSYRFEFTSFVDKLPGYIKRDNTIGGSAGLEYRFNKFISAATIYRPAFASFETDGFYRHVISLDIRIDIDVRRE